MAPNYKPEGYVNGNFTGNKCAPLRSKGYQTHMTYNERKKKSGSSYARPLVVKLHDENGRLILEMHLNDSTIRVGGKIVYNGQKVLHHGSLLTLKQLRAEAARWCWKYLRYIPDALIPGRHVTDDDWKVLVSCFNKGIAL